MPSPNSSSNKKLLNEYKNFTYPSKPENWIPKISCFSMDTEKKPTEYVPIDLDANLMKKITNYYLFLRDNFGLDGVDHQGLIFPLYILRDKKKAALDRGSQAILIHKNFLKTGIISHESSHGIVNAFSVIGKINRESYPEVWFAHARALDESIADILSISYRHWLKKDQNTPIKWRVFAVTEDQDPDLSVEERNKKSRDFSIPKTLDKDFRELTTRQKQLLEKQIKNLETDFENAETYEVRKKILKKLKNFKELQQVSFEHDNSLIPSHAFYAVCFRFLQCPSYQLAKIWLDAAKNLPANQSHFIGFAKQTIIEAAKFDWMDKQGQLQDVEKAVRNGWARVGIGV